MRGSLKPSQTVSSTAAMKNNVSKPEGAVKYKGKQNANNPPAIRLMTKFPVWPNTIRWATHKRNV